MRAPLLLSVLCVTSCFYRLDQFPVTLKDGDILVILQGVPPQTIGIRPLAGGRVSIARSGVTRTSHDDGTVIIRNVPAGDHRLNLIYDPDGDRIANLAAQIDVPIRIADDGRTRPAVNLGRITLLQPATITGHVDRTVEPGTSFKDITIAVDGYDVLVTPDDDGNFSVQGLGAGSWKIAASGAELVSDAVDFSVNPGEQKAIGGLALRRAGGNATLSGKILSPPSESLEQASNGATSVVITGLGAHGISRTLTVQADGTFSETVPEGSYTLTAVLDADHRTVVIPGLVLGAGERRELVIEPGIKALESEGPCKDLMDLDGDDRCFLDPSSGHACLAECAARRGELDAACSADGKWDCDDDADSQPDATEGACSCTFPSENAPGEACLEDSARFDQREHRGICDLAEAINIPDMTSSGSSSSSGGSSSGVSPSSSSEGTSSSDMGNASSEMSTHGCVILVANPTVPAPMPWGSTTCFELPSAADASMATWHARGTDLTLDAALPQDGSRTAIKPLERVRADDPPLAHMQARTDRILDVTASVGTGTFLVGASTPAGDYKAIVSVQPPRFFNGHPNVVRVSAGGTLSVLLVEKSPLEVPEAWVTGTLGGFRFDRAVPLRGIADVGVLNHVTDVVACGSHALVVTDSGTVFSVGEAGSTVPVNVASQDFAGQPLTSVARVMCGTAHNLALLADGSIYAWGDNSLGQLGTGDTVAAAPDNAVRVMEPWGDAMESVVDVAAGGDNSAALTADVRGTHTIWTWGSALHGVAGTGQGTSVLTPQPKVLGLTASPPDPVDVELGETAAFLTTTLGNPWGWGTHPAFLGTSCMSPTERIDTPAPLYTSFDCAFGGATSLGAVSTLLAGRRQFVARNGGVFYGAGENFDGELSTVRPYFSRYLTVLPVGSALLDVGRDHMLSVDTNGQAVGMGSNAAGQLGLGAFDLERTHHGPQPVRYQLCGNGQLDENEACEGGPGCSAQCTPTTACGDGTITARGDCDEGDTIQGGFCSSSCTCLDTCGDGDVVHACEECDDGNMGMMDGCTGCQLDAACHRVASDVMFSAPFDIARTCTTTFAADGTLGASDDVAYYRITQPAFTGLSVEVTRHPLFLCAEDSSMSVATYSGANPTAPYPAACMANRNQIACSPAVTTEGCGVLDLAVPSTDRQVVVTVMRPPGVTGVITYRAIFSLR